MHKPSWMTQEQFDAWSAEVANDPLRVLDTPNGDIVNPAPISEAQTSDRGRRR